MKRWISWALATVPFVASANVLPLRHAINPATLDKTSTWKSAIAEVHGLKLPSTAEAVEGQRTRTKTIALTFDDGPHPGYTEKLISILRSKDAPATFFVIGKQVDRYPYLVKDEVNNGFEVGNHSYSHVTLTKVPVQDDEIEFKACNDAIQRAAGVTPRYARPPGGDMNERVLRSATANGLATVEWTDDPGDYANPGDKVILGKTLRSLSDGGIILLHDGADQTLHVLPRLIDEIRAKGYAIVPLTKLATRRV